MNRRDWLKSATSLLAAPLSLLVLPPVWKAKTKPQTPLRCACGQASLPNPASMFGRGAHGHVSSEHHWYEWCRFHYKTGQEAFIQRGAIFSRTTLAAFNSGKPLTPQQIKLRHETILERVKVVSLQAGKTRMQLLRRFV